MIIVRGVDSEGASSMISWDSVVGGGDVESMGSGDSFGRTMFIVVVSLAIITFGAFVAIRQTESEPLQIAVISENSENQSTSDTKSPIEAELIDESQKNGSS